MSKHHEPSFAEQQFNRAVEGVKTGMKEFTTDTDREFARRVVETATEQFLNEQR